MASFFLEQTVVCWFEAGMRSGILVAQVSYDWQPENRLRHIQKHILFEHIVCFQECLKHSSPSTGLYVPSLLGVDVMKQYILNNLGHDSHHSILTKQALHEELHAQSRTSSLGYSTFEDFEALDMYQNSRNLQDLYTTWMNMVGLKPKPRIDIRSQQILGRETPVLAINPPKVSIAG